MSSSVQNNRSKHRFANPALVQLGAGDVRIHGTVGRRLKSMVEQWLLTVPLSNPAIIDAYRTRNRTPLRELVPWEGEFAGKYLTGLVETYRLLPTKRLRGQITDFVAYLVSFQDDDGYLAPWPDSCKLTGKAPNVRKVPGEKEGETWEGWGFYHILIGLLGWHDVHNDQEALEAACKLGDLIVRKRPAKGRDLSDLGPPEKSLSLMHAFCLLYEVTGSKRYLDMARQARRGDDPGECADWPEGILNDLPLFRTEHPRWESLHMLQSLPILYYATGRERYRSAFEHAWWNLVRYDVHNTGGFSTDENAVGSPYREGSIESCATVAFMALSVDMLHMTGDSVVADQLEISFLNTVLAMNAIAGSWWAYSVPMAGQRKAFAIDNLFIQGRAGSPQLNCCATNGPRGFGLLGRFAALRTPDGIAVNFYGPSEITAKLANGSVVSLRQTTRYPIGNRVKIRISTESRGSFSISLRIPYWSVNTAVYLNGVPVENVRSAEYLTLTRTWAHDDEIRISFDFSLHYWMGEEHLAGRCSIYRGPLLLARDDYFDNGDSQSIPKFDANHMKGRAAVAEAWLQPQVLLEYESTSHDRVRLCDFASAGSTGGTYQTWFWVKNANARPFSRRWLTGTNRLPL